MLLSLTLSLCAAAPAPAVSAADAPSAVSRPAATGEVLDLAAGPRVLDPLLAPLPHPSGGASVAQPVRLLTDDKQELSGTYYGPRKGDERVTGVLLVHDAGSDRSVLGELAEALQKKGFAVLSVDLRGHGESASDKLRWKDGADDDNKKLWAFAKRDLDAAAKYLLGQEGVHSSSLVLVAQGSGCALAMDHATSDESVRAAVLISPKKDELGYDLEGDLAELAGLPIHMYSGKDDKKAVQALAKDAHEANDGYEYVEVTDLRCESPEVLADKRLRASLTAWLGKALEGGA